LYELGNAQNIELEFSMKIPKRYILLRLLFMAVSILLITACLVYYRAHRTMVAARQFVSDVSRLQVGTSGSQEFARIRDKYSRYAETNPNCTEDECVAKFDFDNGWPGGIHVAHPAFLYSILTLSHGSITSSVMGSSCYGSNGGEFVAHMSETLPGPSFAGPFKEDRNMSSDKVAHITYNLTPAASAEQRVRAYAFDERFLGRFGACNDATDMH
jgi:hypothetical protein